MEIWCSSHKVLDYWHHNHQYILSHIVNFHKSPWNFSRLLKENNSLIKQVCLSFIIVPTLNLYTNLKKKDKQFTIDKSYAFGRWVYKSVYTWKCLFLRNIKRQKCKNKTKQKTECQVDRQSDETVWCLNGDLTL